MSDFEAIVPDSDLKERFEQRRKGVTDPARLVAAELTNISEALLELLKYARIIGSRVGK